MVNSLFPESFLFYVWTIFAWWTWWTHNLILVNSPFLMVELNPTKFVGSRTVFDGQVIIFCTLEPEYIVGWFTNDFLLVELSFFADEIQVFAGHFFSPVLLLNPALWLVNSPFFAFFSIFLMVKWQFLLVNSPFLVVKSKLLLVNVPHPRHVPRWIRSSLRWCWPRVMPLAASQTLARFQRVVLKLGSQFRLIWVNYNDLTTTSLEIMVSKGNHPQMALIQISELL